MAKHSKCIKFFFGPVLILILLQAFCCQNIFALAPNIRPFSPRIQAMGGSFVGLADDTFALHYNPAGLSRKERFSQQNNKGIITLIELGVRGRADLLAPYETNYKRLIKGIWNPEEFENLEIERLREDLRGTSDPKDQLAAFDRINRKNIGVGIQGPFNVSYLGDSWGFAYNAISLDLSLAVYEKITPTISAFVTQSSIAKIGYAIPLRFLGKSLFVGGSFKYQSIAYVDKTGANSVTADIMDDSDNNTEDFIKELVSMGQGPGFDWGVLWKYSPSLDLGISLLNAVSFLRPVRVQGYGSQNLEFMAPILTTGIFYHPSAIFQFLTKHGLSRILTDVKLLADYELSFDGRWSFWKGFHFGFETGWFGSPSGWSFFYFRGGINQGYFTWGLGFDFYIAKLDYAYYTQELGPYPGNLPEVTHNLSLKIQW